MQRVNELLEFNIDTPSDEELRKIYHDAMFYGTAVMVNGSYIPYQDIIALPATTRNQKKRARRKAWRNA